MNAAEVEELVRSIIADEAILAWKDIFLQLLEWPFIIFVLVLALIIFFRKEVTGLLSKGRIEISWGEGKHIRLSDLSENLDQELAPIREELLELREILASSHNETEDDKGQTTEGELTPEERERIRARVMKALQSPKFRWRTVEKLARFSDTTESVILELISTDAEIVTGQDKAGRPLARLRSR